jgi:hypothetical protein
VSLENVMLQMSGQWTQREILLAQYIDRLTARVEVLERVGAKKTVKKEKNPIIISK